MIAFQIIVRKFTKREKLQKLKIKLPPFARERTHSTLTQSETSVIEDTNLKDL